MVKQKHGATKNKAQRLVDEAARLNERDPSAQIRSRIEALTQTKTHVGLETIPKFEKSCDTNATRR